MEQPLFEGSSGSDGVQQHDDAPPQGAAPDLTAPINVPSSNDDSGTGAPGSAADADATRQLLPAIAAVEQTDNAEQERSTAGAKSGQLVFDAVVVFAVASGFAACLYKLGKWHCRSCGENSSCGKGITRLSDADVEIYVCQATFWLMGLFLACVGEKVVRRVTGYGGEDGKPSFIASSPFC